MNNDILKLFKDTIYDTETEELDYFMDSIRRHNETAHYEIYKRLTEEYKKDPLDFNRILEVKTKYLLSNTATDEINKKYIDKMTKGEKNEHGFYQSILLVNVEEIKKMFENDGISYKDMELVFPGDEHVEQCIKFTIRIKVSDFRNVMNNILNNEEKKHNR